jgi:hypothetical protein
VAAVAAVATEVAAADSFSQPTVAAEQVVATGSSSSSRKADILTPLRCPSPTAATAAAELPSVKHYSPLAAVAAGLRRSLGFPESPNSCRRSNSAALRESGAVGAGQQHDSNSCSKAPWHAGKQGEGEGQQQQGQQPVTPRGCTAGWLHLSHSRSSAPGSPAAVAAAAATAASPGDGSSASPAAAAGQLLTPSTGGGGGAAGELSPQAAAGGLSQGKGSLWGVASPAQLLADASDAAGAAAAAAESPASPSKQRSPLLRSLGGLKANRPRVA